MTYWSAPSGLHIAYGDPGDAKAMARLHALGFYRGWPVSDFETYLEEPKATPVYVAIDGKRNLAGFAVFRCAEDECELLSIAVDPKRRSKGVGRALLKAAMDDLVRTRVRMVFLEVDETNAPAIALYRHFGFAEIGRRKAYYPKPNGAAATALVMRAPIG